MSWIVVVFKQDDSVQHVPSNWYITKDQYSDGNGRCWFPFTKTEFPNHPVPFKNHQVLKMIRDSYKPNKTDGSWFFAQKVAGPFDSESIAKSAAKSFSDTSENECLVLGSARQRIPPKRFSPDTNSYTGTAKSHVLKKTTTNLSSNKFLPLESVTPPSTKLCSTNNQNSLLDSLDSPKFKRKSLTFNESYETDVLKNSKKHANFHLNNDDIFYLTSQSGRVLTEYSTSVEMNDIHINSENIDQNTIRDKPDSNYSVNVMDSIPNNIVLHANDNNFQDSIECHALDDHVTHNDNTNTKSYTTLQNYSKNILDNGFSNSLTINDFSNTNNSDVPNTTVHDNFLQSFENNVKNDKTQNSQPDIIGNLESDSTNCIPSENSCTLNKKSIFATGSDNVDNYDSILSGNNMNNGCNDDTDNSKYSAGNESNIVHNNSFTVHGQECCCKSIKDFQYANKKKEEAILTQMLLNNTNQLKICSYLENLDKKINTLLEMDKRTRTAAFPQPKLPAPFINLLPISTLETLNAVEHLLDVENCIGNKEELKTYLLLKIGNEHPSLNAAVTAIFDLCFTRTIATFLSYHGKTKICFKRLLIYQVMQETLSGRLHSPNDTDIVKNVIVNILKHAK